MKTLALLFLFLTSFFVRSLRWLAFAQQKEYRIDRLLLFLNSAEGKKELFRIFPRMQDFSKTGLKRPKITARILITSLLFSVILFVSAWFSVVKIFDTTQLISILYLFLIFLLLLTLIPLFTLISIFPTVIISNLRIYIELLKAKSKVRRKNPIIVGITGSYGKTSTKLLLAHVLEKKYSVFKTPKSFNTRFSVAKSINDNFSDQEVMVLEYGAYKKGEIKTLSSWFKPTLAVITGLTKQHLGLFGSIESIIEAKSELVKSLSPNSIVVCNGLDKGAIKICEVGINDNNDGRNLKVFETNNNEADSSILKSHLNKYGKLFFVYGGQQVSTKLMGKHYLEIIRMVILTAKKLGLSDDDIVDSISSFVPNDKFIFSYQTKRGNFLIDDGGTSNPKGFEAAIDLCNEIDIENKILITSGIVDLGLETNNIHMSLALKARDVFSTVIFLGDSGSETFSNIFKIDFLDSETFDDQKKIKSFLSNLDKHEMILVEGRMPAWIKEYLK